jgi:hypothetical protein
MYADAKKSFKSLIGNSIFSLKFIKKDGTEREMRATLNPTLIPESDKPKQELTAEEIAEKQQKDAENPYVTVYDCDKEGWRKINLETVVAGSLKIEQEVPTL